MHLIKITPSVPKEDCGSFDVSGRCANSATCVKTPEKLLMDLAQVWEEHGKTVPTKLAVPDPGKLATIAYGLLPKEAFAPIKEDRASGNLEPEAWASCGACSTLTKHARCQAKPQQVFAMNRGASADGYPG